MNFIISICKKLSSHFPDISALVDHFSISKMLLKTASPASQVTQESDTHSCVGHIQAWQSSEPYHPYYTLPYRP